MATTDTNPESSSTNQPIGTILVVHGPVQAQSAGSSMRLLQAGSPVFLHDRIITGSDGMISIVFGDAARTQLDLGRMSDVLLDEDVFQGSPAEFSEATAEVEQIQEALLAGDFDPTTDLEPTAAGPAAGGPASDGGGSSYVEFSLTGQIVTPSSGAETTGVGLSFLDPPLAELEEPLEPEPEPETVVTAAPTPTATPSFTPVPTPADIPDVPPPPPPPPPLNSLPSAGEFSSFVEERGLDDGTDGPDSSLTTTSGTFAQLGIDFGGDGEGYVTFSHGGTTVTVVLDGNHATAWTLPGTYGTLTIFGDGTWEYKITDNTIDHPDNSTADGDGTTGADDSLPDDFTFTVFDSNGDSAPGTLTINIYDDGPEIGTPQDSILTLEVGNHLTADLDITAGADELASLKITLTEGDKVMTTSNQQMTSGGDPLFWHQNGDGSWSAVTKDGSGNIDPTDKSFTVSVDSTTGTYTVVQDGQLDGGATTTIGFAKSLNGGNEDEAVFGHSGVFILAKGSTDQSAFDFQDGTAKVSWANQGIGVDVPGSDTGSMVEGTGDSDASSRTSEILSLKFYSNIVYDSADPKSNVNEGASTVLYVSSASIVIDHLGTEETAYYTLWKDGVQVSSQLSATNTKGGDKGTSSPSDDLTVNIDSSVVFNEIRFEAGGTIDKHGDQTEGDYRVVSVSFNVYQEGYDQTVVIPFEVTDNDGDTASDDFSVTFDADGIIDAASADALDGDVSTNGMVISGSSLSDDITGTDYNDTILGGGGDDFIDGGSGNDGIDGGAGNDIIFGGSENDTILGGAGNDFVDGGSGDDSIDGGAGSDLLVGGIGDDVIYGGDGVDVLAGNSGNDQLVGGTGSDGLSGGPGDDVLVGDDVQFVGDPADPVIVEDNAPDIVIGGTGNDTAGDQHPSGSPADVIIAESTQDDIDTLIPPPDDVV